LIFTGASRSLVVENLPTMSLMRIAVSLSSKPNLGVVKANSSGSLWNPWAYRCRWRLLSNRQAGQRILPQMNSSRAMKRANLFALTMPCFRIQVICGGLGTTSGSALKGRLHDAQ
jgi:hypothetical protein